jgi:hypothetical protein
MAWNEPDAIMNAIGQYKQQYEQAVQAIANLDQQRVQLVKSTDTLVGAVASLEQLLKNREDEQKAAEVPAVQQAAPVIDAELIDGSPQESPVIAG